MDTGRLHKLINEHFSEEDLQTLCFYLKVDYDSLPGRGKSGKAREFIAHCDRNGMLDDLVKECEEQRPHVYWAEVTALDQTNPEIRSARLVSSHGENVPLMQVHGYSGEWVVENRFTLWKGYELGEEDTVYFHGKAFLLLSVDGNRGSGTQIGQLHISIGNYKATYENSNRINRANVTEDGTLHLDVEVILRTLIEEEGEPREPRFREKLFGSQEFKLTLYPVPGLPKRLKGKHIYKVGNRVYQAAEEDYRYVDF